MRRIHMHDDVQIVAHHRIGEHIGGEAGSNQRDSVLHPVVPVLERLTGVAVDTAQERAARSTAGSGTCLGYLSERVGIGAEP